MSDLVDALKALRDMVQARGPANEKQSAEVVIFHAKEEVEKCYVRLKRTLPETARNRLRDLLDGYALHGTTLDDPDRTGTRRSDALGDIDEILAELDTAQAGPPRPLSPTAGYCLLNGWRMRWDEKREPVRLKPQLWKLLECLLGQAHYPVETGTIEDGVWLEGTSKKSLPNRLCELNAALMPITFPWRWGVKDGFVYREG